MADEPHAGVPELLDMVEGMDASRIHELEPADPRALFDSALRS